MHFYLKIMARCIYVCMSVQLSCIFLFMSHNTIKNYMLVNQTWFLEQGAALYWSWLCWWEKQKQFVKTTYSHHKLSTIGVWLLRLSINSRITLNFLSIPCNTIKFAFYAAINHYSGNKQGVSWEVYYDIYGSKKNETVGWVLNFRVHVLLKSTVRN